MNKNCFISLNHKNLKSLIPTELNNPFEIKTPEICKIAAADLQNFLLKNQNDWGHNFGCDTETRKTNRPIGKMFGVLVVENMDKEIGYLATFSGKTVDEPFPQFFVPSLFDIACNDFFLTKGMIGLTKIGDKIKVLEKIDNENSQKKINLLKEERRTKSYLLQQWLFDQYHFLNKAGVNKSLRAIFKSYENKPPAAGAGECAAPKLFQYAFQNKMKPLAIAEFWWGKAKKSLNRVHGNYYPACNDKCKPILNFMLKS